MLSLKWHFRFLERAIVPLSALLHSLCVTLLTLSSPKHKPATQHTTLHNTAGLLLKLSRVGPGQSLDGRPDAAAGGVGGPVGDTLSSGLKNIPISQGSDWGHYPV